MFGAREVWGAGVEWGAVQAEGRGGSCHLSPGNAPPLCPGARECPGEEAAGLVRNWPSSELSNVSGAPRAGLGRASGWLPPLVNPMSGSSFPEERMREEVAVAASALTWWMPVSSGLSGKDGHQGDILGPA